MRPRFQRCISSMLELQAPSAPKSAVAAGIPALSAERDLWRYRLVDPYLRPLPSRPPKWVRPRFDQTAQVAVPTMSHSLDREHRSMAALLCRRCRPRGAPPRCSRPGIAQKEAIHAHTVVSEQPFCEAYTWSARWPCHRASRATLDPIVSTFRHSTVPRPTLDSRLAPSFSPPFLLLSE